MSLPDFNALRAGRKDCPSDFALDRLHAGELAGAEKTSADSHVEGCSDCTARMAERRAGFDAIDGVDPRRVLAKIRSGVDAQHTAGARAMRWIRLAIAPMIAVTAAVVLLVMPREQPSEVLRGKGAAVLHVFRYADGQSAEVVSGDELQPGDRLRFVVDLKSAGSVHVFGVEASGRLYTAWPLDPSEPTMRPMGERQELDGAVMLDATPGDDVLFLVVCPTGVGTPQCTSSGPGKPPSCPDGCDASPFRLRRKP